MKIKSTTKELFFKNKYDIFNAKISNKRNNIIFNNSFKLLKNEIYF